MSQLHENRMGGHFGVQLNGDLVCCMVRVQNAVQTWQLMDLPHKYVRYRYPVHVICETWVHWLHSSRLSHTSSYLLVHQDGRHAQRSYIIFRHVMKTLYYTCMHHKRTLMHSYTHMHIYYVSCTLVSGPVIQIWLLLRHVAYTRAVYARNIWIHYYNQ